MTQTASQRGKANRRQGKETEQRTRDYLRAWWPDIDYLHPGGVYRTHEDDTGDLGPCVDTDGDHWTIEVKGPRSTPTMGEIEAWAREAGAEADRAGQGGLWVLIVRRPGTKDVGRWHAWLPMRDFTGIIEGHTFESDLACLTVRAWCAVFAPEPF